MAMTHFCTTLQQCAEKLEEELRHNINEFHNLIFGSNMDETKLALERAKDYHYKEIVDAVSDILKQVKIVVFHQDKVQWLSNESNFTANDLKRFSYVKRQVYAFSKPEEKLASFSRSEQNLASHNNKKEKRRTASEISVGTLEAWEKYMDQKEKEESQIKEDVIEIQKMVPKRTLSNARARKKFVSSTFGGFLDSELNQRKNLDSIVENASSNDEFEDYVSEDISDAKEHSKNIISSENNNRMTTKTSTDTEEAVNKNHVQDIMNGEGHIDANLSLNQQTTVKYSNSLLSEEHPVAKQKEARNNKNEYTDLVRGIHNNTRNDEDILDEIMNNFLGKDDDVKHVDIVKPKIVNVIYKKKPT